MIYSVMIDPKAEASSGETRDSGLPESVWCLDNDRRWWLLLFEGVDRCLGFPGCNTKMLFITSSLEAIR